MAVETKDLKIMRESIICQGGDRIEKNKEKERWLKP